MFVRKIKKCFSRKTFFNLLQFLVRRHRHFGMFHESICLQINR